MTEADDPKYIAKLEEEVDAILDGLADPPGRHWIDGYGRVQGRRIEGRLNKRLSEQEPDRTVSFIEFYPPWDVSVFIDRQYDQPDFPELKAIAEDRHNRIERGHKKGLPK